MLGCFSLEFKYSDCWFVVINLGFIFGFARCRLNFANQLFDENFMYSVVFHFFLLGFYLCKCHHPFLEHFRCLFVINFRYYLVYLFFLVY